jgi:DNA sulfur modification protein DndB
MNIYPAMKFKFGNWEAFQIVMRVGELNSNIDFAKDLFRDSTLSAARQREIDESRAKYSIGRYLVRPDNERFFNSLVIAVEGGDPRWLPAPIDNTRQDIFDDSFSEVYGAIKFDGDQKYYALDGQHRMAAINYVLTDEDFDGIIPRDFEKDQISLILLVQPEGLTPEEFTQKYRRVFGHLNRYAKPTGKVSDIIMDEDDVFAILTRKLIEDGTYFSAELNEEMNAYIEKVKTNQRGSKSIASGEPFFTTLDKLYDMNILLLTSPPRTEGTGTYKTEAGSDKEFSVWVQGEEKNVKWGGSEFKNNFMGVRPEQEVIDSLYDELKLYWEVITELVPDLEKDLTLMRDNLYDGYIEGYKDDVQNHALLRPIVQIPFAKYLRSLLDRKGITDTTFTKTKIKNAWKPIGKIDWDLFAPPFRGLMLVKNVTAQSESWVMRPVDRSKVMPVVEKLLRYISGHYYIEDKEDLQEFKDEVRVWISPPASNEEFDDWWKYIEKQKAKASN